MTNLIDTSNGVESVATMRDFNLRLTAGVEKRLQVPGNFFGVVKAIGLIKISFNESPYITRYQSMGGNFSNYSNVKVLSPITQDVVISLGYGTMYDSRASSPIGDEKVNIAPVKIFENDGGNFVESIPYTPDVTISGGTSLILNANPSRKYVHLFSLDTNTTNIRIAPSLRVSENFGAILAPDGNGTIESNLALYAYNPTNDEQEIAIMEII